ncbi:conserved Plasmodium protein, unknown function [Plasmodium ovale]|uniref:J domain-containing protein n=1 Tax=Plasmodium ovale TaxID=36330 RepID=A0A1C3KMR8_PLAOA|nr:conserved Plasmodium protein, unknown function [Plasmodium ovale]
MFLYIKPYCRYAILRKCTKHTNGVKKYFPTTLFCNHLHNGTKGEKKAKNYVDHEEDHKLLKRLKRNEMEDMLGNNDERNALKIKKKYLKLLRLYHPDTYMKEKNEKKKKVKEEIFLLVYKKYKNFSKQYDNMYKSEIIDEAIYENEEEKSERLERYKRYSEGKRNDANHKHVEVYILAGILLTFVTVFFICAYLPINISTTRDEIYDNTESNEKVQMVSCFYNPVMKRYEYLSSGFIPPSPHQLYYFYKQNFPDLSVDEDILKLQRFEIIKLPKNRAKKCRLVYDLKTNELIFLKKKKKGEKMENLKTK